MACIRFCENGALGVWFFSFLCRITGIDWWFKTKTEITVEAEKFSE